MIYNNAKAEFQNGNIDLVNDTINAALLTVAYTPDIDADTNWDDISANEVSGAGYTAGGVALASKMVTEDEANDRSVFDAQDASWPASTITGARYVVLYKDTGDDATSTLIGYIDFGSDQASANNNFTVQWSANGILLLT